MTDLMETIAEGSRSGQDAVKILQKILATPDFAMAQAVQSDRAPQQGAGATVAKPK